MTGPQTAPPLRGDATSQLVQTMARSIGLQIKATGKGNEDIALLVQRTYNAELSREEIWKGVAELFQMAEMGTLPEPMKAKIAGIILRAKSNTEIGAK